MLNKPVYLKTYNQALVSNHFAFSFLAFGGLSLAIAVIEVCVQCR